MTFWKHLINMTTHGTFEQKQAEYLEFKKNRDELISKLENLIGDIDGLGLNITDFEDLLEMLKKDKISTRRLPEFMRLVNKRLDTLEPLIQEFNGMAAAFYQDEANRL